MIRARDAPREREVAFFVIPGLAKREPGVHVSGFFAAGWIPGLILRTSPE
jgi:hypothetical protein